MQSIFLPPFLPVLSDYNPAAWHLLVHLNTDSQTANAQGALHARKLFYNHQVGVRVSVGRSILFCVFSAEFTSTQCSIMLPLFHKTGL